MMARRSDVLVVGAGPAGMAATVFLRRAGLSVVVVDDQPAPGGQIWRSLEARLAMPAAATLGPDYAAGAALVEEFRASGADYRPSTQLWQLEKGWRGYASGDGTSRVIEADTVLLATGAQERPSPFPGWTLPGVMTVGAAQILLKSSEQVPTDPVWIAGSGPLPLLYAIQLLSVGGRLAGFLDTSPAQNRTAALRHLPRTAAGWKDIAKGLGWISRLRRSGARYVRNVASIEAEGGERLTGIRYTTRDGARHAAAASVLLIHEGVVPAIHATLALGCGHDWNDAQLCLEPRRNALFETDQPGLFVAGDGGRIAGAAAAIPSGEIAAIGIATRLGRLDEEQSEREASAARRRLASRLAARPFLDALFRPRAAMFAPPDDTVVCRCEEVTAAQIRAAAGIGSPGVNQVKAFTRAGMGPCQGRQCGYAVSHIVAAAQGTPVADIGFFNIRSPLKPITIRELAALAEE
jgi:NADPH-dependent 2,4-dienoyl-CoA reductase/sulfur reductase-like enzyme